MPKPTAASSLLRKTWKLPKGCSISQITLRETDGNDERVAAVQLGAKDKGSSIMSLELIALATVAYWLPDGKKVTPEPPDYAMERWNTRTRALVSRAFDELNGATPEELADFLFSGALEQDGEGGQPVSTLSTSTSVDSGEST